MRDTLAALIEGVETATGPDRELDAEIGALLLKNGLIRHTEDGRTLQIRPHPRRYTASLDAAASLMPPDHHVEVRGVNDQWHVACNPTWDHSPHMPPVFWGVARTEPLARLAAALRARMESER